MATVLAVTSCGGSQSDVDPVAGYDVEANTTMTAAKPPISKAEFVSQINGVCRHAWKDIEQNWDRYMRRQKPELSARKRFQVAVKASLLPGIDFYIFDEVRRTGAPSGNEETIEAIIGPFQAAVELGWAERWRAFSVPEVAAQFETYNEGAARYGLDDCLVDRRRVERATATR